MDQLSPFLSEHILTGGTSEFSIVTDNEANQHQDVLSNFERIITTHPPVLESLLLQLPTSALLKLYHTSKYLQSFLQAYPIAWKYLSFRLFGNGTNGPGQAPSGNDAATETTALRSKPFALDLLILGVVAPFGTRLCNLDLDNTAVLGHTLTSTILPAQRGTLQHLSVRGCKNVSLKYHILPYLTLYGLQKAALALSPAARIEKLVLKSLYTFRCRHHRRRPYFPGSLQRRDSDAEPTHELIKICHDLGIWTDTSWCPTPGGRCLRRKEYYTGRTAEGRGEVWVVYDRLWRSSNKIGQEGVNCSRATTRRGLMWEEAEIGEEGEPLGVGSCKGDEGKTIPGHLRRSHRVFVDNYNCHDCGTPIAERCEICSVRMHCMGCRKILCASCAFSRPLPGKKAKAAGDDEPISTIHRKEQKDLFWWAPGETRSPNIMQEIHNVNTDPNPTAKLKLQWCCLQPSYFGGGGVTFVSNGIDKDKASRLRTAPLPQGDGWEDPEFVRLRQGDDTFPKAVAAENSQINWTLKEGHEQILYWLEHASTSDDDHDCPRNLCQECYQTKGWQSVCHSCGEPFCFQHDFRGLSMRICGYRSLSLERDNMRLQEELKAWQLASLIFSIPGLSQRLVDMLISLGAGKNAMVQKLASTVHSICRSDEEAATFDSSDLRKKLTALSVDGIQNAHDFIEALEICFPTSSFPRASLKKPRTFLMYLLRTYFVMGSRAEPELRSIGESWNGCASILCPELRLGGDHRPNCPAVVKVCTLCKVHVCPDCLSKHPPCDCSHCSTCYLCPGCYVELEDSLCKKAEEVEAARVWRISKELANDVAEQLGQFFAAIVLPQERHDDGLEQVLEYTGDLFTVWDES